MLCWVVGSVSATWHLERVAYVPGETIHISGHIHNKSKVKVKKSKASLIQVCINNPYTMKLDSGSRNFEEKGRSIIQIQIQI